MSGSDATGGALLGQVHRLAPDLRVCRIAAPSTFAVPLGLATPGADLVAWAVTTGGDGAPTAYLLVLYGPLPETDERRFVLATHFRDMTVAISGDLVLSPGERTALAHAALTARFPADAAGLRAAGALLSFVAPTLDGLIAADTEPLALVQDDRTLTATGTFLPEWLVLPTGTGYQRLTVTGLILRFDEPQSVVASVAPARLSERPLDRAILVGSGEHRIGAIRRRRAV